MISAPRCCANFAPSTSADQSTSLDKPLNEEYYNLNLLNRTF